MKIFSIIIIFFCITTACYKIDPIIIDGSPLIYKLQNDTTFYTDILILSGEYLGNINDLSYVVINDMLIIPSANCLSWSQSKIQIEIPLLPKLSNIYVVVAGKKVFYDKDNYYQYIVVLPYPSFECVLIPAGSFDMGSEEINIPEHSNERPVHNVILTKSFYVSIFEVSQRLYSIVMKENPSEEQFDYYPVYNVLWLDAIKFCNNLSLLDSLEPVYDISETTNFVKYDVEANGWKLPTEAEWEYFADLSIKNESELLQYAWFTINSANNPHSIGRLEPNRYGLYDVLGNVWEWCWDWYDKDYYNSVFPVVVNPKGPDTGIEHTIRGGSCDDGKIYLRKEYRCPRKDGAKIGFRIVRNVE